MKNLSMSLEEIPEGSTISIYGTGKRGKDYYKIFSSCRPDITVKCFLDSFKECPDLAPPIVKPTISLLANLKIDIIVICSEYYPEIIHHLTSLGIYHHQSIKIFLAGWFDDTMPAAEIIKSENFFKIMLNTLPKEPFVYDALGRIEIQKNNYETALAFYTQMAEYFPDDVWGHIGCAQVLNMTNRNTEAERIYESITGKFPDVPSGYLGLARLFENTNRNTEAERLYKLITGRFPDVPFGYLGLARLFENTNRNTEAERLYESVISRFPDCSAGYLGLAGLFINTNRITETERLYESVISKFPDCSAGYLGLAGLFEYLNRNAEAEKLYKLNIIKFPDYINGYLNKSLFLLRNGNFNSAKELLFSIKDKFNWNDDYLIQLQWAHIAKEEFVEAKKYLFAINVKQKIYKNRSKTPILFNHIPKCGGVTITRYLEQNYTNCQVINADILSAIMDQLLKYFISLTDEEKENFLLIYSHRAEKFLPHVTSKAKKILILRHPSERLLSHYYYNISKGFVQEFQTFISQSGNTYIEMFCTEQERDQLEPSQLVKQCHQNIRNQYDLVGITEDMDGFLSEVQRIAKLPIPYAGRRDNITSKRKSREEIDPDIIDRITEKLSLDIELYKLVKEDWERRKRA